MLHYKSADGAKPKSTTRQVAAAAAVGLVSFAKCVCAELAKPSGEAALVLASGRLRERDRERESRMWFYLNDVDDDYSLCLSFHDDL